MKNEIIVVLDRSGSMGSIKKDMVGGLRSFVEKQAAIGEAGFTLTRFDDMFEVVHESVPISAVRIGDDVLDPRGNTALLDAIGKTVVAAGERFAKMPEAERPERVALLIVTDGQENASREWKIDAVRELLRKQQDEWKWAVTMLGCGIDAIQAGAGVGILRGQSLTSSRDPKHVDASFSVAAAAVGSYRSTGQVHSYTEDERSSTIDSGDHK